MSYARTLNRVETYFDKTATVAWERLTGEAPVSRIRRTVRAGRDAMRAHILAQLPHDLLGSRILDAGCGTGQMTAELARRGAEVVAVDISPSLIDIARRRLDSELASHVHFATGDMLVSRYGRFDFVVAMDSLIYYTSADIAQTLIEWGRQTDRSVVFTVPPRTPMLMAMWRMGQAFPRSDRSPTMVPQSVTSLGDDLRGHGMVGTLRPLERINSGFYISQAMEYRP